MFRRRGIIRWLLVERNSELERLRRRRQLLMTGREMSLKQWVSRVESLDTESKEAVKALRAMAVRLGTRLSLTLVPVMYMTNMSKGMIIRDKFRDFELVQNCRLNQSKYSGEGVVYKGIIAVLQKADQELNKRRDQNKKNTSNWYESEDKIDQLLRQFGLLIANMETDLSFPILPEEPVLMRSSLPLLEKTLIKMGTELNEMEIKVNEMKDKFTTSLKTGDSAMDAFFQLFCSGTSDYDLE